MTTSRDCVSTDKMSNREIAKELRGISTLMLLTPKERTTLLQAAAALSGDGWMPIESAPTDSNLILVATTESVRIAYWSDQFQWVMVGATVIMLKPTHWQPLPPPPENGND